MIFVTVGAQMPFDRLIRAIDAWADHAPNEVFAQIGASHLRPRNMSWARFLDPMDFLLRIDAADLLIAHAGMGSIITALEHRKPLLIMPRRGDLGETRNDHQIATARRFRGLGLVDVVFDEHELIEKLDRLDIRTRSKGTVAMPCPHRLAGCAWAAVMPCRPHAGMACPHLLASLRGFAVRAEIPCFSPGSASGMPTVRDSANRRRRSSKIRAMQSASGE